MSMVLDIFEDLMNLKVECLACRRCAIGGCMVDGKFLSNVFSNMNCSARMMAVGQNPGRDEVERGEPFVGVSGRFWDEALESVGLKRADFYIANMLRCYTPGNRKPLPEEIDNCRMFLDREVELLKPLLVVALGGAAFKQLTGLSGIMKHRGTRVFSPRYKVFVFPMLHPSPLNMNLPDNKAMFMADLAKLRKAVDELGATEGGADTETA